MLTLATMLGGAVAVFAAWRVVEAGRSSVWVAMGVVLGASGVAGIATRRIRLSGSVPVGWSLAAGAGTGVALYLATAAFVLIVRRWPVFDRHVAEVYNQRKGLPLGLALFLASGVVAPGEEVFWRGLFQGRLAESWGWLAGASVTWGVYVVVNASSRSLPILAAAIVAGGTWGALALWTHGVLTSTLCHAVWTGLMLTRPPGGPSRQPAIRRTIRHQRS